MNRPSVDELLESNHLAKRDMATLRSALDVVRELRKNGVESVRYSLASPFERRRGVEPVHIVVPRSS